MIKENYNLNKSELSDNRAQIIVLLGQSNAEGNSHSKYLSSSVGEAKAREYFAGYDNVKISFINSDFLNTSDYRFVSVTADQGYTVERFGPELGMAEKISGAELDFPTYIIKWAYWNSRAFGGSLYAQILKYITQLPPPANSDVAHAASVPLAVPVHHGPDELWRTYVICGSLCSGLSRRPGL